MVVESSPESLLTRQVRTLGYKALKVELLVDAERSFAVEQPDLVIIDRNLKEGQALDFIRRIRDMDATVPLILLLDSVSIDESAEAARAGADKFLGKPVDPVVLGVVLARLVEQARARKASPEAGSPGTISPFFGTSPAILRLEQHVRRILSLDRPVLIQGETGVGKSMLARWIHNHSPRKGSAFVELNCAGLSKELLESDLFGHEKGSFTGAASAKQGLLEISNHGTVFLDEIGDMDLAVQPKILKAIEERRYRRVGATEDRASDIRLIGASHKDLSQLVSEGRFRSDLFYRIGGLPLLMPPLRERREDIAPLAKFFLDRAALEWSVPDLRFAPASLRLLEAHAWPGNIRELKNAVERAVIYRQEPLLEPEDFLLAPDERAAMESPGIHLTLAELEELHIQQVLEACRGRVDEAARWLGISRSSLYQRIRRQPAKSSRP